MSLIRLALAQLNTHLGDLDANLQKHLTFIERAERAKADLVVFPELSLTGYSLRDLVVEVACRPTPEDPVFARLLQASENLDVVFSFVERGSRDRYYIAAAYLSGGRLLHLHRKTYLPTYGLFEEGRFFAQGSSVGAFHTPFGRVGILICEDFWHASAPYLLWMDGADLFLFLSASPSRGLGADEILGSVQWVERLNQTYAGLFTTVVAHSQRVGFEDGLKFGGAATLFGPDGRLLAKGPQHEEALTVATVDLAQIRRTRERLPLLRDERPELLRRELSRILEEDRFTLDRNPFDWGEE